MRGIMADGVGTPVAHYHFDDDLAVLYVSSDEKRLVLRGGRHAYARLAEILGIFASLVGNEEHDHWSPAQSGCPELVIVLRGEL
jgi:hypothetical protein